ncbi:MAG: hypothetical protein E7504_04920 [Ruminococcus sp.]|nr:hypothetical protein [Ruminococcus sp.]
MQDLINCYEESRTAIISRIKELRDKLKTDKTLKTKEQDALKARIDLLCQERTELQQDIREMREHTQQHKQERSASFRSANRIPESTSIPERKKCTL